MRRVSAALLLAACSPAGPAAAADVEVLGRPVRLPAPVRAERRPAACRPRPKALTPLLWSHTALQAADAALTLKALALRVAGRPTP